MGTRNWGCGLFGVGTDLVPAPLSGRHGVPEKDVSIDVCPTHTFDTSSRPRLRRLPLPDSRCTTVTTVVVFPTPSVAPTGR